MEIASKSAEQKFAEAFEGTFVKKAEKSPETNEKKSIPGVQQVHADDADPGEVGDQWEGADVEQYSSSVKETAGDTREGVLGRVFAAPPSPRGKFRKVAHTQETVSARVRSLFGRR